jgi:hypothetical protein
MSTGKINEAREAPGAGGLTTRAALLFPSRGNNFCADVVIAKKFFSKAPW